MWTTHRSLLTGQIVRDVCLCLRYFTIYGRESPTFYPINLVDNNSIWYSQSKGDRIQKRKNRQAMSEKRQQNWFVPLRVRFRSPAEQEQWEREHAAPTLPAFHPAADAQAPHMPLPRRPDFPHPTHQINKRPS